MLAKPDLPVWEGLDGCGLVGCACPGVARLVPATLPRGRCRWAEGPTTRPHVRIARLSPGRLSHQCVLPVTPRPLCCTRQIAYAASRHALGHGVRRSGRVTRCAVHPGAAHGQNEVSATRWRRSGRVGAALRHRTGGRTVPRLRGRSHDFDPVRGRDAPRTSRPAMRVRQRDHAFLRGARPFGRRSALPTNNARFHFSRIAAKRWSITPAVTAAMQIGCVTGIPPERRTR
ncbi:MAG: hypothetical protein JWN04_6514 [Myxococcaceae bacterium]|nr:hypothetical protein [Myxococcaceae bacterium]